MFKFERFFPPIFLILNSYRLYSRKDQAKERLLIEIACLFFQSPCKDEALQGKEFQESKLFV